MNEQQIANITEAIDAMLTALSLVDSYKVVAVDERVVYRQTLRNAATALHRPVARDAVRT